jgi:hypothetical protein
MAAVTHHLQDLPVTLYRLAPEARRYGMPSRIRREADPLAQCWPASDMFNPVYRAHQRLDWLPAPSLGSANGNRKVPVSVPSVRSPSRGPNWLAGWRGTWTRARTDCHRGRRPGG